MKSSTKKNKGTGETGRKGKPIPQITTKTAVCWLGEDGIIRSVLKEHAVENIDSARENTAAGLKLAGGTGRPILFDMSRIKSMDKAARDYYSRLEKRESADKAVALLVSSPVSRIIGNFFMGLNKPTVPTRLFTSEYDALEWLKTFL